MKISIVHLKYKVQRKTKVHVSYNSKVQFKDKCLDCSFTCNSVKESQGLLREQHMSSGYANLQQRCACDRWTSAAPHASGTGEQWWRRRAAQGMCVRARADTRRRRLPHATLAQSDGNLDHRSLSNKYK